MFAKDSTIFTELFESSASYFQLAFDESLIAKALVSLDGRILKVNRATCILSGYSEAELLTGSIGDISHPEDIALTYTALQPLLDRAQPSVQFEKRFIRKDGTIIWALVNSVLIRAADGKPLYRIIEGQNITNRKQAEDALRRSEAKFRAVIENSSDGFLFCDTHCIISYLSPSYLKISGYCAEEWVGRNGFEAVHSDDLNKLIPIWDQAVQHPESSFTAEFRMLHKNGNWLWVESTVQNLMNNPDVQSMVLTSRDITQRKRAEEMLHQQMEENLRHTRELETITLISINMRQAQTRIEMIDMLLADSLRILGAQGGMIGLLNGKSLVIQRATGLAVGSMGRSIPQNNGLCWQVIQAGVPRFIDEQDENVLLLNEMGPGMSSGIIIPLKSDEMTIGIFFGGYETPLPVRADQRRLATAIAEMAGVALHRVSMSEALEKIVVERSHELQTIYRVTASASPRLELGSAMQNALNMILPAIHAGEGAILLWNEPDRRFKVLASRGLPKPVIDYLERANNENSIENRVRVNRQPLIVADGSSEQLPCTHDGPLYLAALPMTGGERTIGVLDVIRQEGEPFNIEELTLLAFITDHLGLVVENSLLFRQVEDRAILEERSRMARALHDSVTQLLYSIVLYAEGTNRLAGQENWEQARANLAELSQMTSQALKEMRLMVYELRSPVLHNDGLVKAVQHRLDAVEIRSGIHAAILADHVPQLPERVEEALYRITLEALNNSIKHAHAKNVTVFIRYKKKALHLCVRDDGDGFLVEEKTHSAGMGIIGIKERVEYLNGTFNIRSAPGSGCEVEVVVPIFAQRTTRRPTS